MLTAKRDRFASQPKLAEVAGIRLFADVRRVPRAEPEVAGSSSAVVGRSRRDEDKPHLIRKDIDWQKQREEARELDKPQSHPSAQEVRRTRVPRSRPLSLVRCADEGERMIYVGGYLAAIIAANLVLTEILSRGGSPWWSVLTAFLFIGADFTLRDGLDRGVARQGSDGGRWRC